uniref:Chloramphenicol acetyltransferase n=1 Tax=Clostridium perfringens TaxID=1502 RepID=Q46179_CLOPF|nr:chloramphenicol acetyltransferase [Clostridium perfringens]
MMMAVKLAF